MSSVLAQRRPAQRADTWVGTHREASLAVSNAAKLATSFALTFSLAVIVRVLLPRTLGPEQFGMFQFGEAFAATFFALLGLGVDTYVGKEVSLRHRHASDFFGGLVLVRLSISAVLLLAMWAALEAMGKPHWAWHLTGIFGLWQLMLATNATFATMLNARGTVDALAIVNVASKVIWAGAIGLALLLRRDIIAVAWCVAGSEMVRGAMLFGVVERRLELRLRVDLSATWSVLRSSAPFFLAGVAQQLHAKVDVTTLAWMATDEQVGWYAVASNLASMVLLLIPIINAVVQPMAARVARRGSTAALNRVMTTTVRLTIALSTPVGLILFLHADNFVSLLFGPAYGPAANMLRVLAFAFPLLYVCSVTAMHLIQLGRGWAVSKIALLTLLTHPMLSVVAIASCTATLGVAGAPGVGAAFASLLSAAGSLGLCLYVLRRDNPSGPLLSVLLKLTGIAAVVALVHRAFDGSAPGLMGLASIPLELAIYGALATAVELVPLGPTRAWLFERRH